MSKIEMSKTENLRNYIEIVRKNYPQGPRCLGRRRRREITRKKALRQSNALTLLSECFGREKGAIEWYGKRLIYEAEREEKHTNKSPSS